VPLHSAPAGSRFGRFHGEDKYTTNTFERLLRLPMYYGLEPDQVEYITDTIKKFYK
jgi:dTDP-4-amino-4,6-dideoxygalactose transaminase